MKKLLMFFLVALVLLCSFTALAEEWTCPSCGKVVTGNFCNNCGAARSSSVPTADDENANTPDTGISEKYTVSIHVDFIPNLIFSTYDVEFLWDNNLQGTLEHGQDQDFTLTVEPGEYTITFQSTESSSVKGDISLNVDGNIDASYKIFCYSDKVDVETLYVDHLAELADGDVRVDVSASEYTFENYEDVTAELKALGFTNIKYDVLYDIVFGWTEDGEVKSVSIAGNNDFKRGDIFKENAEVIITYHRPEEADPSNITMDESSSSFVGMDYNDVEQAFKDYGFTNITLESTTVDSTSYTDGEVYEVRIDGYSFNSGSVFKPDKKVKIKYYIVKEPEPNLTVENCPELAAMLSKKADIDDSYSAFASKYKGRIIEFDGRVDYCAKHEDYNTRFDYLLSAGDYDPNHYFGGPIFKFEDVNYSDLHTDLDTVSVGLNVHIVAEVVSYNENSGLFYLEPISVTGR